MYKQDRLTVQTIEDTQRMFTSLPGIPPLLLLLEDGLDHESVEGLDQESDEEESVDGDDQEYSSVDEELEELVLAVSVYQNIYNTSFDYVK